MTSPCRWRLTFMAEPLTSDLFLSLFFPWPILMTNFSHFTPDQRYIFNKFLLFESRQRAHLWIQRKVEESQWACDRDEGLVENQGSTEAHTRCDDLRSKIEELSKNRLDIWSPDCDETTSGDLFVTRCIAYTRNSDFLWPLSRGVT